MLINDYKNKKRILILGFTLVEILLALFIFTILAGLTASVLKNSFQNRLRLNQLSESMKDTQLVIMLIQHDIQQIINRPILLPHKQSSPALVGKPKYIEFTRSGLMNPLAREKRSQLKRVAYLCEHNQLIRKTWDSLDRTADEKSHEKVILSNLALCQFAYLDKHLQVLEEWRENSLSSSNDPGASSLPKAIQINVNQGTTFKMSWLTIIPQALYAEE